VEGADRGTLACLIAQLSTYVVVKRTVGGLFVLERRMEPLLFSTVRPPLQDLSQQLRNITAIFQLRFNLGDLFLASLKLTLERGMDSRMQRLGPRKQEPLFFQRQGKLCFFCGISIYALGLSVG
jgi:hypothetical protein